MVLIAVFIGLVFFYGLVARRLERTVITAPIVFTAVGLLIFAMPPWLSALEVNRKAFLLIAEIGLVMTLFTEAAEIDLHMLKGNRRVVMRLLSTGMLLTILLGAVGAFVVLGGLSLWQAGILAAILAPTDARLGQVIINSPRVPKNIRQVLSVEAGLNDGLAVPFLMVFIALALHTAEGAGAVLLRFLWEQISYGTLIGHRSEWGLFARAGAAQKWMVHGLERLRLVSLPLLCVMATEASMFIAAFVAGLMVQIGFAEAGECSADFAKNWGQLFNFFVFFLFGLLVARVWMSFNAAVALYAILSLTVIRMVPVALALARCGLSRATLLFMGWFGPRGLASIVLGLVYLERHANLPGESTIRLAVMATVLLSIFAHGLSALPGIDFYATRIATLDKSSPEWQEIEEKATG